VRNDQQRGGNLAKRIAGLFTVFYINNSYIASHDTEFLQEALNILAKTFKCVSFATSTKEIQAMICTPGKIQVQLLMDSYKRMHEGVAAGEELQRAVVCHVCNKALQTRSLRPHLSSAHGIHQQVVIADALLPTQGDGRTPYSAHDTQVAQACSAVSICCTAISGIYTQRTPGKS
jgi:hypothetical protein